MNVRAAKNHLQEIDSCAEGSIALTEIEVTAVISVMQCFTAGKKGKAEGEEQRARSREQGAERKEQRAKGRERRAWLRTGFIYPGLRDKRSEMAEKQWMLLLCGSPYFGNAVFYFLFENFNQLFVGIDQFLFFLDLRNDLLLYFKRRKWDLKGC